ncbi:hypothetical protein T484DRAFT_1807608 [Baffinella frigidus]|nr:hypothetical protein T484DRAFT_1807608 [Cryptophyta sp. CCMP2293]
MASRHRRKQDTKRKALMEELVLSLTDLERGTNNFDTSVEFAVANVEHHKFLCTQPTRVKEGVRDLLDLLELKSQMGKRAAVASAVSRLQALGIVHGRWDEEECLYGKLQLVVALAEHPLVHSATSDAQLAQFRNRHVVADGSEAERRRVADLIRASNADFDAAHSEASDAGSLSDWDSDGTADASEEPVHEQDAGADSRAPAAAPAAASHGAANELGRPRRGVPVRAPPALGFKLPAIGRVTPGSIAEQPCLLAMSLASVKVQLSPPALTVWTNR